MMAAAAMGAVAFQKGLGAIHALSHPIGAVYDTHHGTTNAVVMPMVLDFNRRAIDAKLDRAAAYLDIAGGFDGFYGFVMDLRAELGVPANLAAMGVGAAERRGAGTAGALSPPTPMRPRALKNHDSLILSHTHALHHPSIHPGPA